MICFSELVIFLRWAIPGAFFRFWNRCGQHKCTVQDDFVYYFLQKSPTVVWPVEMPVFFLSIILPSTQVYPQFLFSLSHSRATLHRSFSSMFIFRTNKHFLIMCLKNTSLPASYWIFFPLCLCAFISNECRVFHLGVLYISTFLYTNDRFFIYFFRDTEHSFVKLMS